MRTPSTLSTWIIPSAGKEHHFRAYRVAGTDGPPVTMKDEPQQLTLRGDDRLISESRSTKCSYTYNKRQTTEVLKELRTVSAPRHRVR